MDAPDALRGRVLWFWAARRVRSAEAWYCASHRHEGERRWSTHYARRSGGWLHLSGILAAQALRAFGRRGIGRFNSERVSHIVPWGGRAIWLRALNLEADDIQGLQACETD